jgi:hypothetical protein
MLKQYIRDKDNHPIGLMVSDLINGEIHFGYSVLHKNDKWNKTKAHLIAFNRLHAPSMAELPYKAQAQFERFEMRSKKYFVNKQE